MQLIRHHAYARAALVGNPSDGYGGKTISIIVPDFSARAVLYEWDQIELVPSQQDQTRFSSLQELIANVQRSGYYGGIRLVKATTKRFAEFCQQHGFRWPPSNFSIRYESDIPRQVGLGGSSAIVVATLRCLMEFFGLNGVLPPEVQASLALSVETEELGLPAGLQDRVAQTYEGLIYMDFTDLRDRHGYGYPSGTYERLDPATLPPLYLAYRPEAGKPRQVRFNEADPTVASIMRELANLTDLGRAALLGDNLEQFNDAVNGTFDLRRRLHELQPRHVEMVERARQCGASANYAGSGGAIVGSYREEVMFTELQRELSAIGCRVLKLAVTR